MAQIKQKKKLNYSRPLDPRIFAELAAATFALRNSNKNINKANTKNYARRHIRKARRVAMQKNVRLPQSVRMQFCDSCNSPLIPGKNCTVRVSEKRILLHCAACKHINKFGGSKNSAG